MNPLQSETYAIILFDGVCNLCNNMVQRIIRNDPKGYFKFASLQSKAGQRLLRNYGLAVAETPESIVLFEQDKVYQQSTAALRIAARLEGGYRFLKPLRFIPAFLRDRIYHLIARNRYRWWGKKETCMLPTPGLQHRFLDSDLE
jgi:predicted DCC family thiol-disulfide oxidoreductase YuxK